MHCHNAECRTVNDDKVLDGYVLTVEERNRTFITHLVGDKQGVVAVVRIPIFREITREDQVVAILCHVELSDGVTFISVFIKEFLIGV